MKRYFKAISYICLLAFFSVALSGCTSQNATPTTTTSLVVWSFENPDVWKAVGTNFQSVNKGVKFVYRQQTFDDQYESRVLNSQLSGEGPDVWAMPNDWVYRHKDKLIPYSTTEAAAKSGINSFVPSVGKSVFMDNKIYALSPSAEPLIIYYNPKLLEAAAEEILSNPTNSSDAKAKNVAAFLQQGNTPQTWEAFSTIVPYITKKSSGKIIQAGAALGTSSVSNSADILTLLMLQQGTDITNISTGNLTQATYNLPKDNKQGVTDFPGKRALDFYTSFADPANPNYTWDDSMGDTIQAFAKGKVGFIFGYSSLQNTFDRLYPDFHDYKKAFVPQLTKEAGTFVDYARFNAFAVSNTSGEIGKTLGWGLIKDLCGTYAGDFSSANRVASSLLKPEYDKSLEARTGNNPDSLELGSAISFLKGRYPVQFDNELKGAISNVNNKTLDSKAALDKAANATSTLMAKESW